MSSNTTNEAPKKLVELEDRLIASEAIIRSLEDTKNRKASSSISHLQGSTALEYLDEDAERRIREMCYVTHPIDEETEQSIVNILRRLPMTPQDVTDSSRLSISFLPLTDLRYERLSVADLDRIETEPVIVALNPAGYGLNLALSILRESHENDPCFWEDRSDIDYQIRLVLDTLRVPQLQKDQSRLPIRDGRSHSNHFNPKIDTELLRQILDSTRFRNSGPTPSSRRTQELCERFVLAKGLPASHPIQCVTDLIYYSLLAFTVRNGRSSLCECKSCGRLYFSLHGNSPYCHFRNPERPDSYCQGAIRNIRALDTKRYKDKAQEKLRSLKTKVGKIDKELFVKGVIWNKQLDEEYRYFRELPTTSDGGHTYQRCLEWLNEWERGFPEMREKRLRELEGGDAS